MEDEVRISHNWETFDDVGIENIAKAIDDLRKQWYKFGVTIGEVESQCLEFFKIIDKQNKQYYNKINKEK